MKKKDRAEHFSEKEALVFHAQGKPGKIEIKATKPLETAKGLVSSLFTWSCGTS